MKTYETVVHLVDEVENLKPGMTAVVNMHVDKIEDVLAVPVQAIVQANRETWCYVGTDDGVERRDIKIGRSNDKFVHVQEGLGEGDRVVLNPMDIFEENERETNEISPESGVPEMPESLAGVGFDAPPATGAPWSSTGAAGSGTSGAAWLRRGSVARWRRRSISIRSFRGSGSTTGDASWARTWPGRRATSGGGAPEPEASGRASDRAVVRAEVVRRGGGGRGPGAPSPS